MFYKLKKRRKMKMKLNHILLHFTGIGTKQNIQCSPDLNISLSTTFYVRKLFYFQLGARIIRFIYTTETENG